jgi:MFS superfamily sulfate permease-like transporter
MNNPTPPTTDIARFIPGLANFKGVASTLLRTEFVVAITLFAVLVPTTIAYGDLAGVMPFAGLYVALGAMVMYVLFGPSFHILLANLKQSKSQDANIATQDNLR